MKMGNLNSACHTPNSTALGRAAGCILMRRMLLTLGSWLKSLDGLGSTGCHPLQCGVPARALLPDILASMLSKPSKYQSTLLHDGP